MRRPFNIMNLKIYIRNDAIYFLMISCRSFSNSAGLLLSCYFAAFFIAVAAILLFCCSDTAVLAILSLFITGELLLCCWGCCFLLLCYWLLEQKTTECCHRRAAIDYHNSIYWAVYCEDFDRNRKYCKYSSHSPVNYHCDF